MFYRSLLKPSIWLIVFIVGLPLMGENIYSPSLPDIASFMKIEETLAEYTLSIYLFGFAFGVMLWGVLSDRLGRRPCLLMGLSLFIVGCLGCWISESIESLLLFRFIQAFGGSTGSVLGQSIARDAFPGKERAQVFATIATAMAFALGVGPVIGGYVAKFLGWKAVFTLLTIVASLIALAVFFLLPETRPKDIRPVTSKNLRETILMVLKDRRVMGASFLVGACNGIMFSYFAEGPFVFIDIVGIEPSYFGWMSFIISGFWALGGIWSKGRVKKGDEAFHIIQKGCLITIIGAVLFTLLAMGGVLTSGTATLGAGLSVVTMGILMFGIGSTIPNTLVIALEDYRDRAGSAASVFGFTYYLWISLFTYLMANLHDDTVYPMPVFFLGIALAVYLVFTKTLNVRQEPQKKVA